MAITRQKKEELIALYKEQIEKSTALVFTDFRGTSNAQIQGLRAKLGATGARYIVVKNTLFARALNETERPLPESIEGGPNAVVFLEEDIGKGVTALKDWIKDEQIVEIRGGILESELLDQNRAEALADLPTKEQTLASILAMINAPASSLARIINAPSSSLARVINARAEQLREQEAA